ncbi:MAG TPA: hypothetical protein DCM54_11470 [Gammaproteobacteria bacterium]|nr:hypothetical protein [Gammaproteobacteria bacterium]|tara:strand:- start:117 stop:485 length:369 start_codon:yes stop_codon:yes gene_type:complete
MELNHLKERYSPAIEEILDQCKITDEFVDREKFQVYMATIWGNAVLDPERSGLEEGDLESLHDFLNEEIEKVVGPGETITSCYEFIVSKEGEESLTRQQVAQRHRDFLHHFARLILAREVDL